MGYYKNNDGDLLKVAGSSLYADNPIGTILAFGGSEIPVGWHLCDGTAVSRTAYAELFAIIGTNFGVGDGSTTFNLPDLQGEFLRGAGTNSHSGQGDGANVGVHQDATVHCAMETSGNRIYYPNGYALENKSGVYTPSNADSYEGLGNWYYSAVGTNNNSGNGAVFTSRPTNTSVNYIIKCKPVAFPSDVLTQIGDALSYSTTEKLTGGRWIDGKPIYRKCFEIANFNPASPYYGTVDVGMTEIPIEAYTKIEILYQSNSNDGSASGNFTNIHGAQGDAFRAVMQIGTKLLFYDFGTSYPLRPCTLRGVLEYTKTTD